MLRNDASNDTFHVLNWLNLAGTQYIIPNNTQYNLVPKYLTQYFKRNTDLHHHATRRRNDLHPPKPKRNMRKRRTTKYTGTINFNCLLNCVKSATFVNDFMNIMIKYFTL